MVVYQPASPHFVRLATAEDMFSDESGSRPKCKVPKFSHYRRSRVSKAPRKRTFIMHMTKYPDAWISSLASPTLSEQQSSLQDDVRMDTGYENPSLAGQDTGAGSSIQSSSAQTVISHGSAADSASVPAPVAKRRVSPFAAASCAALQICHDDSSAASQAVPASELDSEYGPILTAASDISSQFLADDADSSGSFSSPRVCDQQLVLLGAGGQGSVYKGVRNDKVVAFKFPNGVARNGLEGSFNSNLKSFNREVAVLTNYQHPNIISCFGVFKEGPCPYIIEEFAERGSLHDWLYTHDTKAKAEALVVLATRAIRAYSFHHEDLVEPLSSLTLQTATAATMGSTMKWQDWSAGNILKYVAILQVLLDIANGLKHLHNASPTVVHRDLKPDNVLLTADGVAKLADFGVAKILQEKSLESADELFGTANYAAPEDLWGSPTRVGPAADVYSLGCIAWECFAGERPWMGSSEYSIMFSVGQGMKHLPLPESWPSGLKTLLARCLAFDPSARPEVAEVRTALVAELDWAAKFLVAAIKND